MAASGQSETASAIVLNTFWLARWGVPWLLVIVGSESAMVDCGM